MQLLKLNDLVRVGHHGDGGYVISESLLRGSTALLSFGINDDWSFEEDFCDRAGVICYGFDFSVNRNIFRRRGWKQLRFFLGDMVKRRTISRDRWKAVQHHFEVARQFGQFFSKHQFFCCGIDSSTHGVFKRLDDILAENLEGKNNIFLKVDIEGYEYKVLDDILRFKGRFHTLAMEIHGIHDEHNQFPAFWEKLQQDYYVYHLHANNYGSMERRNGFPDVIEISCVRKDVVTEPVFSPDLSHLPIQGIDFPNDLSAVDYKW